MSDGASVAADNPPYMNAYGNITKILDKIRAAQTPDRFTTDYLGTVLGFTGGGARPFIPLAKRLGLLGQDGTPTELYKRFRGSETNSKAAMAEAIRKGYPQLYKRNEYVHKLDKKELQGLLVEITGMEATAPAIAGMIGTFEALKKFADFDAMPSADADSDIQQDDSNDGRDSSSGESPGRGNKADSSTKFGVRFGYTITLNLPDTNDITVFNAIFRSLKENLLS
jgi:hypothetical protein